MGRYEVRGRSGQHVSIFTSILVEDDGLGVGRLLLLHEHDRSAQGRSTADELGHPGIGAPLAASILVDEAEPREGEMILLEVPLEKSIASRKDLPREIVLSQEGIRERLVLLRVGLAEEIDLDGLHLFVID